MHVRIRRFGGWHQIFGNGQDKIHVQVFDIPVHRFFGVFATVSHVVNAFEFHVHFSVFVLMYFLPVWYRVATGRAPAIQTRL